MPRRGFTLIEILVVIGIIAILSGLTAHAAVQARLRSQIAQTTSLLRSVQLGLTQYRADHRRLPKAAPVTGAPDSLLIDDAPSLYGALLNLAEPDLGGGRGAPYLHWEGENIGLVLDRAVLAGAGMGQDVESLVRRLEPGERDDRHYAAFQRAHAPGSAQPLVLLDTWGNPIHYRAWAPVSRSDKAAIHASPPQRSVEAAKSYASAARPPLPGPVSDRPHDPYGYDLWSAGPNGVNEWGHPDSDDIRAN